jgi:hypothetical protein
LLRGHLFPSPVRGMLGGPSGGPQLFIECINKDTCSEKEYRTGVRQQVFLKAVDRRAGELMEEYQDKADDMDAMLGEVDGGGPIRRQLDQYGELLTVVVGKFNELSSGGHDLLEAMACSRVAKVARASGLHSRDTAKEEGAIKGELRRQLSVVNLRASMSCLLDRLHQCGEGQLRNKRQNWILREEERMAEERELQWATRLKGSSLLQKGQIFHG